MDTRDTPVLIRAGVLDDLCSLAVLAADRLGRLEPHDPLTPALRGAVAEARVRASVCPV